MKPARNFWCTFSRTQLQLLRHRSIIADGRRWLLSNNQTQYPDSHHRSIFDTTGLYTKSIPHRQRLRLFSTVDIRMSKLSEFTYPINQPVVLLDCESAFTNLTDKEKFYAHYLSKASWYGGLIVLIQTSPESPLIFALLHQVYKEQPLEELKQIALSNCGFTEDEFKALLVYSCGIYANMGNYKGFGDTKFIPDVPKEKVWNLIKNSNAFKSDPEGIQFLWDKCHDLMFSLRESEKQLGFSEKGITTYFSSNCSSEDSEKVNKFLKEKKVEAYNIRTCKTVDSSGKVTYEIRLASVETGDEKLRPDLVGKHEFEGCTFIFTRGDYAPLLSLVVQNLNKAKEYAANENEKKMLEGYIKSFQTGELDDHKNGSRYWIKDKGPIVETYIGFIETYRDPAGMRGEFEGFVSMVNKPMSAKFAALVSEAKSFLPLLPWPPTFEKDRFLQPDFTSLDVLTFAGSGIPAGICIPNYDEIRQNEGFKNVSLGNVIPASYKEQAPNFLNKTDQELFIKYRVRSFEVQVGLHELLGHGSGKLFQREKDGTFNFDKNKVINPLTNKQIESWYEPGETYDSKFTSMGSSYEECRAECVGLFLSTVPKILRIFSLEGQEADEAMYVNWLSLVHRGLEGLEMYNPNTSTWLQAHSQARYVIMQVLLEAQKGIISIERITGDDGNPDLLLTMDRNKILTDGMEAVGKFLQKLQVYKSIGDFESAKAMYDHYSQVTKEGCYPFLEYRDIVMARKKPRKFFVQTNTICKGNSVELVPYDASPEGLIKSWVDRLPENKILKDLMELWKKDACHFVNQ